MSEDSPFVPPVWLDASFFRAVWESGGATEVEVLALELRPAAKRGDHYASVMYRAAVELRAVFSGGGGTAERRTETVIVKTVPPEDTAKGRILSDAQLFQNEWRTYAALVPQLEAVWWRHGQRVTFAGRLLYAAQEPRPVLVLEDLCLRGYDIQRDGPFERDELRQCLAKLAKWHAASHVLALDGGAERSAELLGMRAGLFKARHLIGTAYMSGGLAAMIEALEEAGGFEAFLPKLRALEPHLLARCEAMNDAWSAGVRGPIYVLNHGDFHSKNLMVRRRRGGQGGLEDILFIDFQMCFLGPLSCDLTYASFTFLSREQRDEGREELMRYYFDCFRADLRTLGFADAELPQYGRLQEDFRRWRCYELFLAATNLPLTPLGRAAWEVDIDRVFDSAEYRAQLYRHPDYIAYLRALLPRYDAAGYLD